jgi:hypothetical protein
MVPTPAENLTIMEEQVRIFITIVLLGSAAYVVATNLQFRSRWPAMFARSRARVESAFPGADLAMVNTRPLMVGVASFAGAGAGCMAGLLFNAALIIFAQSLSVGHAFTDGLLGTVFGAAAFAILAIQD